jgi:hypothetical protein
MSMDKKPYQSMTFWGGLLLAVAAFVESQGIAPSGTGAALTDLGQAVGTFLGVFGLRRALG